MKQDNDRRIKWSASLTLVRHAESEYNILKMKMEASPIFQKFKRLYDEWDKNPGTLPSSELIALALQVKDEFSLGCSDRDTKLTDLGIQQAIATGKGLESDIEQKPDIIVVSPYFRAKETLRLMQKHCPLLQDVPEVSEDRVRELDHGLALLYNNWRVFFTLYPDQKALCDLLGPHDYRWPNGENILDVQIRTRGWFDKLIRDYAGLNVFVVTHHLTILAIRGLQNGWSDKHFIHQDEHNKPANCGVTLYKCHDDLGKNGKLMEERYNKVYYNNQELASLLANHAVA